ncbi:MAG TPA: peptidoglycan editing factor PgeF [Anaerolineae bacterium]|nr:peptidoglycan editing factor PgeF [Anaerolineae bacterium]
MIWVEKEGLKVGYFAGLQARGVAHGVFTRGGGVSLAPFGSLNLSVSVPDEKERVYENRRRAYGLYGLDTGTIVHAHLVHGAEVAVVGSGDGGTWTKVDGLVTAEGGVGLTMNYADCTPIFLYDEVRQVIGVGHAGWQGAVVDLPGGMVRTMGREFGSEPADLWAGIGPTIGACCYEVGEPVVGRVREAFAEGDSLLVAPPAGKVDNGRPYFDLPEANRRNLWRAGVREIEMAGVCTACRTDLFFSHRAERGKTGRFGVVMVCPGEGYSNE